MQLDEYINNFSRWQRFSDELCNYIRTLLRDIPDNFQVFSRVKSWESITIKLKRTNSKDLYIKDIIGVKVLVKEKFQLKYVLEVISKSPIIIDYSRYMNLEDNNFESAHMFINITHSPNVPAALAEFQGINAEVRVITEYGQALADLDHAIRYKPLAGGKFTHNKSQNCRSIEELDCIVNDFTNLINKPDVHEKYDIHPFMLENDFLIHANPEGIVSEAPVGLGPEYRIDFVVREATGEYILVEIENPHQELLTQKGIISAKVNHAVQQVEDWQEWIEENISTMQKSHPGISAPRGLIIIGRSNNLLECQIRKIARRNINNSGRIKIITYDDVIDNARSYIKSIKKHLGL